MINYIPHHPSGSPALWPVHLRSVIFCFSSYRLSLLAGLSLHILVCKRRLEQAQPWPSSDDLDRKLVTSGPRILLPRIEGSLPVCLAFCFPDAPMQNRDIWSDSTARCVTAPIQVKTEVSKSMSPLGKWPGTFHILPRVPRATCIILLYNAMCSVITSGAEEWVADGNYLEKLSMYY